VDDKPQKSLEESNFEFYELMRLNQDYIELSNEAVGINDAQFKFRFVNRAYCALLGYEKKDLIGAPTLQFVHPALQEKVGKILNKRTETGENEKYESKLISKDGRVIDVLVSPKSLFDSDGNYQGAISIVTNITNQKAYEQKIALSQELLRTTLGSIQEGVISMDSSGLVLFLNPMAEKLTGWKESEILNQKIDDICKFYDFLNTHIHVNIFQTIQRQVNSPYSLNIEKKVIMVTKSNQVRKITYKTTPLFAKNVLNRGYVFVFRDSTSQDKLQEEALQSQKMESIGILAGGIAHDFNNILTSIMGNISIAKLDLGKDQTDIIELMEDSEKAIIRANKLTKQLLTFSKGGTPIKKVTSLTETIEENANFALRGSKSKLFMKISSSLWNVEVDEGQIGQCVHNLIINATQSMPDGGNIILDARNVDESAKPRFLNDKFDYIVISIMDQGFGIPEEIHSKIFDPYFTTKIFGTGLGLAVVYSIITKHNGHITLDSKMGEGTIFYIYLPAVKKPIAVSEKKSSEKKQKSGRILIMDDEGDIRNILGKMLKKLGFHCDFTKDGRELIAFYREQLVKDVSFDFLILDLTIRGGMGGKEAVSKILAMNPDQDVIVTSGYSTDPVMSDFESYGFKARLIKPFTIADLKKIFEGF